VPVAVLFDSIYFHERRRAIEFGLEIAEIACHSLQLNWRDEDDLIEAIIEFLLAHDWPKAVRTDVAEAFLNLLLNEELLARLSPILRKAFSTRPSPLLTSRTARPGLFDHRLQMWYHRKLTSTEIH
jgi:hypothetical protein